MITVLDSLNSALHRAMAADRRVYLLGEDILDPYGGAFRVARGLSTAYPDRVLTTPISEAGITGLAAGMALRGLRPVVEIMFGDFLTLAADQLINHAAKFRWEYNDQVRVPLVVRTPMGGRRGYGPTHSQTLEKHFLGVPGLGVMAPAALGDPGKLLETAILHGEDPLLFIENKLLYLAPIYEDNGREELELDTEGDPRAPVYRLRLRGAPAPQVTLAAYGYMAELARQALLKLAYEREVFAELVVYTRLSPFDIGPLLPSVESAGRLLVVEEGTRALGWGAGVLAELAESPHRPGLTARRLAAKDLPIPASVPLERQVLPGVDDIIHSVHTLLDS